MLGYARDRQAVAEAEGISRVGASLFLELSQPARPLLTLLSFIFKSSGTSSYSYGFLLDAYVNRFEAPGCRRVKQIDSSLRSRSADSAPADFLG